MSESINTNDSDNRKSRGGKGAAPEHPHKTLRETMADCVSALSLGPEDLESVRAAFARKKTARKDAERRDGNRGGPE